MRSCQARATRVTFVLEAGGGTRGRRPLLVRKQNLPAFPFWLQGKISLCRFPQSPLWVGPVSGSGQWAAAGTGHSGALLLSKFWKLPVGVLPRLVPLLCPVSRWLSPCLLCAHRAPSACIEHVSISLPWRSQRGPRPRLAGDNQLFGPTQALPLAYEKVSFFFL